MFISTKNEQIALPLIDLSESLRSSLMESNLDSPDCSSIHTIYTDVNIVPEHEKNELLNSMANLEGFVGQIAELRLKHRVWNEKRREALNKILDIKGSIRVFCRVRPFLDTDRRRRIREPISVGSEKVVVKSGGTRKEFEFDKAFPQQVSQEFTVLENTEGEIFVEVEPILRSALDGHNVCILAYGQTGTGKTFTMDGTNGQPGIIPRALKELFVQASCEGNSLTFSMSMLEVYMGSLRDLLAPRPSSRAYVPATRCNLNIQTDPKGSVEVEGLTEVEIVDCSKARWWYSRGRRARSTSWTNVNETSSRSHCLTRITIFRNGNGSEAKTKTIVSKLWMVDLGGSERLLKTGASGLTLDEGRAINLSLSALGDVIASLRRKRGHVPYRNSKLTQILKDSLGDGSKVLMLVHVSPCEEDVGETICSLCFAKRARAVESNREQPEDVKKHKEKKVRELEQHMREAEEECKRVKKQIQKAEFLLADNRRLYEDNACVTPKEGPKEASETRKQHSGKATTTTMRTKSRSLPRFMTSTVASRERQSASEKDIVGRTRNLLQVRLVTRMSVQFATSQSISFSDRRFRAALQDSNRRKLVEAKLVEAEIVASNTESPKCNGSETKLITLPRSKVVISSDPNLRTTISRHMRRMSDLI